ncbi:DUF1488 family protein, partial [Ralstonia pseudosolanacearum]|uniref:DUF1488 family protein n=1 Tax=Ralstonia pseudosolanacearum TaxID=1310165 RepID=UPI003CF43127
MNISFTGKTFRSVGDLFFQAIVDGKVLSCFVTSEALSLCDCAHQKVSAEEIYRNYRDWIEQAASDLIRAGALAPVIVRGRDLAASRGDALASPPMWVDVGIEQLMVPVKRRA